MSDFDQEDIVNSGSDFDEADIASPSQTSTTQDKQELPELGQAEAAAVSFGQGSSLGLAPIASGVVGAGINAAEQLGDVLGLSTDSQLEKQGFSMPDKKTGFEGLMQAYYDARDTQKAYQDAASEQYPVQSIAANIAGSIPATIVSGGATGALSKILPQADKFTKATTLGQKVAAGAREGAKAGALTGFGSGDAKLSEGEIYDTVRDTADSAVGGAVVGGALPVAGKLISKTAGLVGDLPIAKQIGTAFKGGRAGIKLNETDAGKAIKTYSEDLLNEIQSGFRKAGMTKANAMDYADEVGVRVNAGETFQDVMDDIISRGASSVDDRAEKLALYNSLKSLRDGSPNKAQESLDLNRAKSIQKMEQKGFDLVDSDMRATAVSDIVPGSKSTKDLLSSGQTFTKQIIDPQTGLPKAQTAEKLILQAAEELPININKYDLNNLSLRELEDVLSEVNRHTGDLTGPAKTKTEQIARSLAGQLRSLSEEALEGTGTTSGNASLSKTFSALGRAGIDDNVLTNSQVRKDAMVDKLRNTVTAGNPINRERMFQYLEEASPEGYKGFKEGAEFLNEFNDLAKQVKPLNSSNAMGLLGSARNIGLTAANKAGAGYQGLKNLSSMPVEKLSQIAQQFGMSSNSTAKSYASPLLKAAQADERQRSAILYGLYQQPAFRELYQSLGEEMNDTILPVGTDRTDNK